MTATGVYDTRQTPSDTELFEIAQRELQLSIRTNTIAKILSFDAQKRTVKVEVQIRPVSTDQKNGKQIIHDPIVLQDIPVLFPFCNGGYITFPLQVGDTGMLCVFDRSIDAWRVSGESTKPIVFSLHNISSACFLPGMIPDAIAEQNPINGTDAVLESSQISIGKDATQYALLGDNLIQAVDLMLDALVLAGAGQAFLGATSAQQAWDAAKINTQSVKVKIE